MNIAGAIKKCRLRSGLEQQELARRADISASYLSLIEAGKREPTLATIRRVAGELNVPVDLLFLLSVDDSDLLGKSDLHELQTELLDLFDDAE